MFDIALIKLFSQLKIYIRFQMLPTTASPLFGPFAQENSLHRFRVCPCSKSTTLRNDDIARSCRHFPLTRASGLLLLKATKVVKASFAPSMLGIVRHESFISLKSSLGLRHWKKRFLG